MKYKIVWLLSLRLMMAMKTLETHILWLKAFHLMLIYFRIVTLIFQDCIPCFKTKWVLMSKVTTEWAEAASDNPETMEKLPYSESCKSYSSNTSEMNLL